MRCLKRTLQVLISLLIVFGNVAIAIGIWMLLDERIGHFGAKITFKVTKLLYSSSYVAITFGICIVVIGTIGVFGASLKKRALLRLFSLLLIIPLLLSVSAMAVSWYAAKDNVVRTALEDELLVVWENPAIYSKIEENLKCCGISDQSDYGGKPPESCKEGIELYYSYGCLDRLRHVAYIMASVLAAFISLIIALEALSIALALEIRRKILYETAQPVRADEIVFKQLNV